jgi:hypothetical protein
MLGKLHQAGKLILNHLPDLGGVGEGQPAGHDGGLEGALPVAAVPATTLLVTGRDGPPGQVLEPGVPASPLARAGSNHGRER